MAILAFALSITPGRSAEARGFGTELDRRGLRARYEELNRQAGLTRHLEWLQAGPDRDTLIVVFETDTPDRLVRPFDPDDEYDRWWVERVKRVFGFDPASAGPAPQPTFVWETPQRS
jgi:hypothetical protein